MDTPLPLRTVLDAVAEAISETRSRLDAAQRAGLDAFLEDDGRPRTVSIRPQADSEHVIELPLLTISPPTVLQIVEASVEFDVDPAGLAGLLASGGETLVAGLRVVAEGLGLSRARLSFIPSTDGGGEPPALRQPGDAGDGTPLADLLSAPLLAAHEARVGMAKLSLEQLLTTNFEPTADGRALEPRTLSLTVNEIIPGSAAGSDGHYPTAAVTRRLPFLALFAQPEPLRIKDVSVACLFEVLSVSQPLGLSGVAHPPDAALPPDAAPLLHIAMKAEDVGVAPDVAEWAQRLTDAVTAGALHPQT